VADAPPPQARKLAAFVGDWTVSGTMIADGKPAAVSGRWHFDAAADGWCARGEMTTAIEGLGSFDEYELIGFDPAEGKIHMVSMNRFAVRDHVGDWVDDERLAVVYRGRTATGDGVTERIDISFAEPDEITAEVIETVGDAVAITTELRMVRRG
jgi:hypothetical protein